MLKQAEHIDANGNVVRFENDGKNLVIDTMDGDDESHVARARFHVKDAHLLISSLRRLVCEKAKLNNVVRLNGQPTHIPPEAFDEIWGSEEDDV